MPTYLALLYDDPAQFEKVSPQEMQAILQRYRSWRIRREGEGAVLSGYKLADGEGRVLRRRAGRPTVTDGPFAEGKELVGGYFVLRAASYEEALAILEDCPHLEFGSIAIRAHDATVRSD
ncbi:MAG TPA: YciI family protein [Candidatus Polarisedimenticolia bacterium]|nr:YciI family protein [Candidatus Polarisedimenticolia bacterium]